MTTELESLENKIAALMSESTDLYEKMQPFQNRLDAIRREGIITRETG